MSEDIARLRHAIDRNDIDGVKDLISRNPALHRAPLGYGKNGPLTWVAECRVPWGPPTPARLAMARWMIENGSDVHQGGDGPLMRAALNSMRIPMMELLVAHGANVNAEWNGDFPILFAPCESVDPESIQWLLEHGANPNRSNTTALDYLIGSYARTPELARCIDLLIAAGGVSRYSLPGVIETIQDRPHRLAQQLDAHPGLIHHRFPELDCGSTSARRLLLTGTTLLHVAAEFGAFEAAKLLIERGADPNAPAVGGHTPIYHSATQRDERGLAISRLLLDHGANLTLRVKLPGHYERPEEVVDCTPLGYAVLFPGNDFPGSNEKTIALLRERGGLE